MADRVAKTAAINHKIESQRSAFLSNTFCFILLRLPPAVAEQVESRGAMLP